MWTHGTVRMSVSDHRRRLIAVGGFALALVLLVFWHPFHHQPAALAVAVQSYDSAAHTIEGRIAQERRTAASATRAESLATSHASGLRRALATSRPSAEPPIQLDPRIDMILAAQDTALALAHVQITELDTALDLSELRAARADSLLHVAVREVERRCRIVWVVPCPSRRLAAAIGAVSALGIAVVVGR